jgi:CheY-like chemotaxis protein
VAEIDTQIADDRYNLSPGDLSVLIIEDDLNFARILLDMARGKGFKGLVATNGRTGLTLAVEHKPTAITLDIGLPQVDGWTVLERLKHDTATRYIPVHIISALDAPDRGFQRGAKAFLEKPATPETLEATFDSIRAFIERRVKNLLIVEDDEAQRKSIVELIGDQDVNAVAVSSGEEALKELLNNRFDCMVLDLKLPDMTGFELIQRIKQEPSLAMLPIVVYTGQDLTRQEETELHRLSDTIIIKDVNSPERLLDETTLFLHRVQSAMPRPQRRMLDQLHHKDPVLAGKKILIVDDDVRNIFALSSMLERFDMEVVYAESGPDAISLLQTTADISAVLMDIMMPEMDGYEAIRLIREKAQFQALPIIALTAKAMKGDREKCLEAGASDYISKPIDSSQLLSLLRVWLFK